MSLTSRILLLDVTENGPCGLVAESGMSALGQKQTCAAQKVMSALPPEIQTDCGGHFLDYLMAIMTFVEEGQHYPGNYYNQH